MILRYWMYFFLWHQLSRFSFFVYGRWIRIDMVDNGLCTFFVKTPKVSLCNTEIIPRFDCHSSIVLFGPWKYLQILLDVKSIQNHFWIKGITILNLSFCNDMMKNERLCYALKKEIWFLENAMVINVRKLFGFFDSWKEISPNKCFQRECCNLLQAIFSTPKIFFSRRFIFW